MLIITSKLTGYSPLFNKLHEVIQMLSFQGGTNMAKLHR